MQKLPVRDTYTPLGASQALGNCGLSLNSPRGVVDSVAGLKTPDNNLDGTLTPLGGRRAGLESSCCYSPHPPLYTTHIGGETALLPHLKVGVSELAK